MMFLFFTHIFIKYSQLLTLHYASSLHPLLLHPLHPPVYLLVLTTIFIYHLILLHYHQIPHSLLMIKKYAKTIFTIITQIHLQRLLKGNLVKILRHLKLSVQKAMAMVKPKVVLSLEQSKAKQNLLQKDVLSP